MRVCVREFQRLPPVEVTFMREREREGGEREREREGGREGRRERESASERSSG